MTDDGFKPVTVPQDFAVRGKKGGKARAAKLSPERRSEIAREAAVKRWSTDMPEKDDSLIVTVELASGKFNSHISIPLFADDDAKQAFVGTWLAMIEAGIKAGRSHREATQKTFTTKKTFTNEEALSAAIVALGRVPEGFQNARHFAQSLMKHLTKGE